MYGECSQRITYSSTYFFMQFRLLGQAHCKMSMFSVESASACRNVVVSYSIQTACLIKNLNRMEPQMENGMNVLRNISHSVRRSASSLLLTAHRPSTLCQHFHLACPTATITQIHSRQMTVYLARFLPGAWGMAWPSTVNIVEIEQRYFVLFLFSFVPLKIDGTCGAH